MKILFDCETCGKSYSVGKEHAGRTTRCQACGVPMQIPFGTTTPPPQLPLAAKKNVGIREPQLSGILLAAAGCIIVVLLGIVLFMLGRATGSPASTRFADTNYGGTPSSSANASSQGDANNDPRFSSPPTRSLDALHRSNASAKRAKPVPAARPSTGAAAERNSAPAESTDWGLPSDASDRNAKTDVTPPDAVDWGNESIIPFDELNFPYFIPDSDEIFALPLVIR